MLLQFIKKRNPYDVDTYKSLGVVVLDLDSFAEHSKRQEITFPLTRSTLGGGRIIVSITVKHGEVC